MVEPVRVRGGYERFVKPAIDRSVGVCLLIVLLPIIIIVALVVRWTMGTGLIFRQARTGLHGRPFTIYKFRTMGPDRRALADAYRDRRLTHEHADDPRFTPRGRDRRLTHKHINDPRHTPVGRILRGFSLDELPQLWNVVRGDMSLVGPRPELVSVVDNYDRWQHLRHEVRPGLTGLWQVSARGDVPMHEATHIDLAYVSDVSLRNDLKIIFSTIPVLLGRRKGV